MRLQWLSQMEIGAHDVKLRDNSRQFRNAVCNSVDRKQSPRKFVVGASTRVAASTSL